MASALKTIKKSSRLMKIPEFKYSLKDFTLRGNNTGIDKLTKKESDYIKTKIFPKTNPQNILPHETYLDDKWMSVILTKVNKKEPWKRLNKTVLINHEDGKFKRR